MITKISGRLVEKKDQAVVLDNQGIFYEIIVPAPVCERIDDLVGDDGVLALVVYQYLQIGPSTGLSYMIGFSNEVERDFFLSFIKVSGIGPRAAVKALDKPISQITQAIESGDVKFLTTLPGIGSQRAKEVVAKLQGKVGKYGLIQDSPAAKAPVQEKTPDWQDETLEVLLQLQYKKPEAQQMIEKALDRNSRIQSSEELLNEIYKQKVQS